MTNTKAQKLAHFYEGKNILITGATGFIGKICLLKILSAFDGCGQVYVMLRSKKGLTPQQRFNKLLQEAPFNPKLMQFNHNPYRAARAKELAEEYEKKMARIDWSKVQAVDGDMSCNELGLESEIKLKMCQTIEIVFNIAASVQFDAPLKQNLRDNYLGTRNMLQLATKFQRLISFVHVSTFYVNSHLSHVEERVLPVNCDHEKMSELIQWAPDSMLDKMGTSILENRPNTYIYTKAMSENLVQMYQGQLPISIVRPSIVVPARKEPEPGWVDNVNGPMGLGVLASLGILRNIDWNYWGTSDFVPVDYVVNSMLAAAERTARAYPKEIKVYNCSTSSANPTTWGRCFEYLSDESDNAPPYKMIRIPIKPPKHRRANKVAFELTKLSEILFAYLIDMILVLCGQKRLLVRLTSKLQHGYDLMRPFTTNEYTCSNENLYAILDELDEQDRENFDFDVRTIDWHVGFRDAYYGTRKWLLKEELSNVPSAVFKKKIMYAIELVFKTLFILLLGWASHRVYTNFVGDFVTSVATATATPLTGSMATLPVH